MGKERACSISIFLSPDCIGYRLKDDIYVQHESPMFNIPDIIPDAVLHICQLLGFPTESRHLAPACNAWFYVVPHHVFIDQTGVFFRMLQHVRTWTYHAHVAPQHIKELGRFIQIALTQEMPPAGNPRIVLGSRSESAFTFILLNL